MKSAIKGNNNNEKVAAVFPQVVIATREMQRALFCVISTLEVSLGPMGLLCSNDPFYNLLSYLLLRTAGPASGLLGHG